MTLVEEFEQQWTSLTNCITSEILRNSNSGRSTPHEYLEEVFANEKKRWQVRGQYQYAWLELLRKKDPAVAADFEKALNAVQLKPVLAAEKPSGALMAGSAAGGAAVGYGLAKLMAFSTLMTLVGTAAIGVMGFGIGKTLQERKIAEAIGKDCEAYKEQLQAAGKELAAIVIRAEQ